MKKGQIFSKKKGEGYSIHLNFESIMLLALLSFCFVIFLAPDHESKVLYGQVIESLSTGFLGYITRGAIEDTRSYQENINPYIMESDYLNYSPMHHAGDLLAQKQQLEQELAILEEKLR